MNSRLQSYLFVVAWLTTIAFTTSACPSSNPPPNVPTLDGGQPDDGEEPAVDAATFPECVLACAKMKSLACPEAEKLPNGKTCYRVCADAERSPGISGLRPSCVANALDVVQVRACGTVSCRK